MAEIAIHGQEGEVLTFLCDGCDELVYSGIRMKSGFPLTGDAETPIALRCPGCGHVGTYPLRKLRSVTPGD